MVSNLLGTLKRYFKILGLFGYREYKKVYTIIILDFIKFIDNSDYVVYLSDEYLQIKTNILHSIYNKQYELQNMSIASSSCADCTTNTSAGYILIDGATENIQLNSNGTLGSGENASVIIYSNVKWNITCPSNTGYLVIDDSTKEIQLNADGKLALGNKATIKIYSNVKWNITAN